MGVSTRRWFLDTTALLMATLFGLAVVVLNATASGATMRALSSAGPGWFRGRPYTVWRAALQHSRRFPYSD